MELLVIIIILALIFDYINGFHDAANSIATIVSTKVLTPFQAVLWAAFFNFVAFFIAKYIIGGFGIANTVSKTVVEQYITLPIILAGIIAAISWNLITWWKGIPSSSSHTLIGGFAGAAIMANGFEAIQLNIILKIAAFIFLAPFIGMVIAFGFTLLVLYICRRANPHTALSCHFATADGEYVYRHPGIGTEAMIDRTSESAAQKIAHELGLDDTFIHEDPHGWKISRFVSNARNLDPRNDTEVARAMKMARLIHESGASVDNRFDFYEEGCHYEALLREKGPIDVPGYHEMAAMARRVKEYAEADGAPVCLTHNDFFYLNFLIDGDDHLYLIDWEYAGMGDYANDFGTYVVCCECSDKEALRALEHYFDRKPTFEEVRHNFAYVALAGWCWYVWSLVKEAEGDFVGEWLYIYYNYAKKYLGKVLRWYDESFYTEG